MIKSIIARFMRFFGSTNVSDEQMKIWAKTEYGKEWRYAYNYILPRMINKGN